MPHIDTKPFKYNTHINTLIVNNFDKKVLAIKKIVLLLDYY